MTKLRAKRRLTRHISAAEWRRDRERLTIIEAALAQLDPKLPHEIQDQRLQPYLQQLDELSRNNPASSIKR